MQLHKTRNEYDLEEYFFDYPINDDDVDDDVQDFGVDDIGTEQVRFCLGERIWKNVKSIIAFNFFNIFIN